VRGGVRFIDEGRGRHDRHLFTVTEEKGRKNLMPTLQEKCPHLQVGYDRWGFEKTTVSSKGGVGES